MEVFKKHLGNMCNECEYGGQFEMWAFALMTGVALECYSTSVGGTRLEIFNSEAGPDALVMCMRKKHCWSTQKRGVVTADVSKDSARQGHIGKAQISPVGSHYDGGLNAEKQGSVTVCVGVCACAFVNA